MRATSKRGEPIDERGIRQDSSIYRGFQTSKTDQKIKYGKYRFFFTLSAHFVSQKAQNARSEMVDGAALGSYFGVALGVGLGQGVAWLGLGRALERALHTLTG